jgi:Mg-chelatase subunit ChlD
MLQKACSTVSVMLRAFLSRSLLLSPHHWCFISAMAHARVAAGIAALLCATGITAACSSNSNSGAQVNPGGGTSNAGNASVGNAGAGNNGASTGGGLNIITPGTAGGDGSSGGNGPIMDACAAHVTSAQPIPLDIYIMLDTSGSMLDKTAAKTTKWAAVKAALESFLQDKSSAGLGVGLQFFPLTNPKLPASCSSNADCGDSAPCFLKVCDNNSAPCDKDADCADLFGDGTCIPLGQCSTDPNQNCAPLGKRCGRTGTGQCVALTSSVCVNTESCDAAVYATPASPIASLPNAAAGLIAAIDAKMPDGGTPTAAALSGALQQASAWAKAHPDHRVVAVLATDGLPTSCMPKDIDGVAALAKAGVAATPSISTFVIGVFGKADVVDGAPDNLNKIALAGGTNSAFIVDTQKDVTAQFVSALDTIRGSHLGCEFQIPQPGAGQTLEYAQVNVTYTNAGKSSYVYYVGSASACDATSGGWYYDVPPDPPESGTPTKIIACPTTCSTFQAATDQASVGIALGCMTQTQIK